MILRTPLLLLSALLIAAPVRAGHGELRRELENYQPPALYQQALTAPPAPAAAPENQEFQEAVDRLQRLRKEGLQDLAASAEGGFHQPEPARLARLQPATTNPEVAAEALGADFSLADLETLTLLRSPAIRAAAARARGALESYSQVTRLDEILRQYGAFTEGLMPGVGPMKGESVANSFPFPGVLSLKGGIATQEAHITRERLEIARRQAVTEARQLYWNLLYNHRARKISARTLDLLRRLETVATSRYETGATSFQDLVRIRINRQTLEEELTTLAEQALSLEADLLALLDLRPETAVGAPEPTALPALTPPLEPLYERALNNRQEIRILRARLGKLENMVEMAETMILPGFSLDFSLYEDEAIRRTGGAAPQETFATSTTAARGQGLPKNPFYGTNDAYLAQTRQELRAVRAELEQLENRVRAEVREAWFELDRTRRERDLYAGSVVDLSQTALDVATRGYEAGNVGFAEVIGSYTTWLNANLTMARKKSDLGIARSKLARTLGVTWPSEADGDQ